MIKRLGYFLFGVSLGMIIVSLLFGRRATSCAYFPNQRILNEIKRKEIHFQTSEYPLSLGCYRDPVFIRSKLLINGKINFGESQAQKKPFPIYQIYYLEVDSQKEIIFQIENQDQIAVIKNIRIK
ncbi:MAG: hypothetical protein ACMUEM_05260 [Flavobacteriales bacterium AspAUS03]